MPIQRINFLGLPLDIGVKIENVCQLLREPGKLRMVTFINPYAWSLARKHPQYVAALKAMTMVLPDGEGVALACRKLAKRECTRISFDMTSLAGVFFKQLVDEGKSVMLVGGNPGVDEGVHEKLRYYYPALNILGTSHGYDDFAPKIARIMQGMPDAVIVGMGSPRQEEFLLALRDAGYQGFAITCGGFFDQYLQADYYYPQWVNRWNLRFAWRLYKEPRRLWRRYLIDYQYFIKRVLKVLYRQKAPWVKKNTNPPRPSTPPKT